MKDLHRTDIDVLNILNVTTCFIPVDGTGLTCKGPIQLAIQNGSSTAVSLRSITSLRIVSSILMTMKYVSSLKHNSQTISNGGSLEREYDFYAIVLII